MTFELTLKPSVLLVLGEPGAETIISSCSGFNGNFTINTVPTMSVNLAADALNFRTGDVVSSADFTKYSETTPATVWLRYVQLSGDPDIWGKLFVGEFAGFDVNRGSTNATYTISLRHELAYLNYVSAMSSTHVPGNPADFTFPAVNARLGGDNGASSRGWTAGIDPNYVTSSSLSDLWSNVFQKWLLSLTEADPLDLRLKAAGITANDAMRLRIKAVLEKVTTAPGVPLALNTAQAADTICSSIREMLLNIASGASSSFVHATMWAKLLGEWAPEFLFEIIPKAEGAWIVPATGALRRDVFSHKQIPFNQITDISVHTPLDQELQAVALLQPVQDLTGVTNPPPGDPDLSSGAFGLYKPTVDKRGVVLIRQSPSWLSRVDFAPGAQVETTEAAQTVTTLDRTVPSTATATDPAVLNKATKTEMRDLANLYAKQLYVNERLKGRMAQLTGILRFDVAPGSHVEFQSSINATNYVGKVVQVSIAMDAETRTVGTTLLMANVRTLLEDASEGFSSSASIMYPTVFTDGALAVESTPPTNVLNAAGAVTL